MKRASKISLFLASLIFSLQTSALVDYSDEASVQSMKQTKPTAVNKSKPTRNTSQESVAPSTKSSSAGDALFSVKGGFQSLSVKTPQGTGKVSMYTTDLHFQTSYDIFLDASHYYASSTSEVLNGDGKNHSGNPTVKLGFNWLTIGDRPTRSTIDFIGGASIKGNSAFASSRTDKIVGIETSKRFYDFAIGLGYELKLTGTPSYFEEMAIGNITRLGAGIGWVATPDIRFLVEGASYTIRPYGDISREHHLDHNVSFAFISPQVHLGIASFIELTLGGRFQTKSKGVENELIEARLWSLEALYGNSIFTGFNISI